MLEGTEPAIVIPNNPEHKSTVLETARITDEFIQCDCRANRVAVYAEAPDNIPTKQSSGLPTT